MIIEGHDVEKATQMVDAMQSSVAGGGGVPGLNGCPCDRRQAGPDCPRVANETVPFLVPVPCLILDPGKFLEIAQSFWA